MIPLIFKISKMIGLKSLKIPQYNTRRLFNTFSLLFVILIVTMLPNTSKSSEVTFNKVLKGTENPYYTNINHVPITTVFPGTSYKSISVNPSLPLFPNGNDVLGNFQYVDGLDVSHTIFRMISRHFKDDSTIEGSFFVPTVQTTSIPIGDAYVFLFTIGTMDGNLVFRAAPDFKAPANSDINNNTYIF
jgi:hypothetical protein